MAAFIRTPQPVDVEPSSSSSSPPEAHHLYDVFLSFRGEDTRKTFTDHLHTALVGAGLRVFRDDDTIERGEDIKSELEKAIQLSRSSIVVFSENYASSKWCLDELVLILHRRKTLQYSRSGQFVVVPVFYHVDPSHVRNQIGVFAEAFVGFDHEEEKGAQNVQGWKQKVQGWREALRDAANLGGMNLNNLADGHESKFIKKIVRVIEDKVNHTVLTLPPYLIGIDYRVQNINSWLRNGSTDVGLMAICGMGGIGKTTIARYAFNLNYVRFDGCSFLANIRDTLEKPNGIIDLQRQLISDILKGKKSQVCSIDEGFNKTRDALSGKRVLLVVDDVDDRSHLQAILRVQDWLYGGSKIIITTRHMRLLSTHEACKIHSVENMDNSESLELFCWYAFGQDHPADGYVELSERVIRQCEGHPLALQLLGSSLSGKGACTWESALEKLEAIPDSKVLGNLKMSYDALQDDHDRNLFLDIACFFVGKDKDHMVTILDACDFFTTIGVENLVDRCLLRVDDNNKLRMHQLLQDMGREIVRRESLKEPGKRSRLWHYKDSFAVFTENTGTNTIEGLVLDMCVLREDDTTFSTYAKRRQFESCINQPAVPGESLGLTVKRRRFGYFFWPWVKYHSNYTNEMYLKTDGFRRMSKLRLLVINNFQLTGDYKDFPRKIRWLHWDGLQMKAIPSDLPLESLVALDMRYSCLQAGWNRTMFLGHLKILNLGHSHDLMKTPDFSTCPNLERLILKDCVNLLEVDESIGNLQSRLVFLNLKNCSRLHRLPRNIHMLYILETLIISGCSNLEELPGDMKKLKSLKVFQADGINLNLSLSTTMVDVGTSWHAFMWRRVSKPIKTPKMSWDSIPRSLVSLSLAGCNLCDDAFPNDLSNLPSLQNLDLSSNLISCLPDFIKGFTRLQKLKFKYCRGLQKLVGLPRVQSLKVPGCDALEVIKYQHGSSRGADHYTNGCSKLVDVDSFFKLVPIGSMEGELLKDLRLVDLEIMKSIEIILYHNLSSELRKGPIQGIYESSGIFSIFIPGSEVPSWFNVRNVGSSSLSSTVPSPLCTSQFFLAMCFVYTIKEGNGDQFYTVISNETQDLKMIYGPSFYGIPEPRDGNMMWLSYWKFSSNYGKLKAGDRFNVSLVSTTAVEVKAVGIHLELVEREAQSAVITRKIAKSSKEGHGVKYSGSTRPYGYGSHRYTVKYLMKEIGIMWDPCDRLPFHTFG